MVGNDHDSGADSLARIFYTLSCCRHDDKTAGKNTSGGMAQEHIAYLARGAFAVEGKWA